MWDYNRNKIGRGRARRTQILPYNFFPDRAQAVTSNVSFIFCYHRSNSHSIYWGWPEVITIWKLTANDFSGLGLE
jgi:hypothetical protein